jgi:vitamin B12/bleomycin/antimicrobial peptide transport system ATP-binding/permease protein
MSQENPISIRQTLRRLLAAIGNFLVSDVGSRARWMLFSLFLLMIAINVMNVANSFVGRYFMSAIEGRDRAEFVQYGWLFVAVFAVTTLFAVLFRYTEEHLGLVWREWLTRRITEIYITRQLYLPRCGQEVLSNPDQRMTEDVKQLTTTTLSFLLMMINATLTVLSFSGVLWQISPKLFIVSVLYAIVGSLFTIWLGRPLIRLNYERSDYEANLRLELIRIREHAEQEVEPMDDKQLTDRIAKRIDELVLNMRRIISVNRNLGFFSTGYNYLIQLIPVLLVAPLFIDGEVEFGVIGQSAMAFAALLGAFSLIVTQFQAISSYASVVARLSEFTDHAERCGFDLEKTDPE